MSVRLGWGPVFIYGFFFGMFLLLVACTPLRHCVLPGVQGGRTGGMDECIIVLGYPAFIANALIALVYYRTLPGAFADLFRRGFFGLSTRREARVRLVRFLRGWKRRARSRQIAIYAISYATVAGFALSGLADKKVGWLETGDGRTLSAGGFLNLFFMGTIISMAVHFIWTMFLVSRLLHSLKSMVADGAVRIRLSQLGFHAALRPMVRLFWLAGATLVPLYFFSVLQLLAEHFGESDRVRLMQMGVFFPIVYGIVTPLIFFGHLYPLCRMISFEKKRAMASIYAAEARLLAVQESGERGFTDFKLRLEEEKVIEELVQRTQRIRTLPLDIGGVLVLATPVLLDVLMKIFLEK